jgi:AcrR family transcriptional regulator
MPRKDDRRIQRTRKLLRESMLQLILERGYDDVSIQDVTDKANLGRATFYLHYREKDDLLADVMRLQFEEFVSVAPPIISPKTKSVDPKRVQQLFDFAESRYDLFRIMSVGKGSMVASRYLRQAVRDSYKREIDRLQEMYGIVPTISREFIENYYAGALISLIFWWLDNDMPFTSEEMAEMYMKVSAHTTMLVMPGAKEGLAPLYVELRQSQQEESKPSAEATKKLARKPKGAPVGVPELNTKSAD